MNENTRRVPLKPLAGGVKTDRSASLIEDGQASMAENVEFSSESIKTARGSRKLNNQALSSPAVRCQPDPGYSPLFIEAGKSVPLRGRIDWPYDSSVDIGGDFTFGGSFPNETFHTTRGRSFELQVSFRLPEDFKMGDRPSRGEGAPNPGNAAIEAGCGYDEALDDCTLIVQKGGDGLAPMSWALGVVNAGNHAYNVGLGSALARKSNYFLVFMWLDSPAWGVSDPTKMRYDLATYANMATGSYCTTALRAVILDGRNDTVGYALEPGRTYHASISVTMDSLSGGAWSHNGRVDMRLMENLGRFYAGSFVDSVGGGTTQNLSIWKGPQDSLRYLAKTGIRYSGRDMVHIGLGYRGAPWEALGWVPFGMDSAAMEHKGFRMADCSLNSITDLYGGAGYNLICRHAAAGDSYLTVSRGLVSDGGSPGAWGKSPLGPFNGAWQGYGGAAAGADPNSAFNSEALRGYRVVFPRSADGTMNALRGGVMTVENYTEPGAGQYRLEVQDAENLGVSWGTDQPFLIRAFRWNQQAIDVQELRLWSSSRDYSDERVKWSMSHSLDMSDETEPELSKLQAYLPLDDGGGRVCAELVRGKSAYFAPFGLGISSGGQEGESEVYLSGEGEALVLDLSENPVFAREMRAMLQSNKRGLAVEVSFTMPQAYYGIARTNASGLRSAEYEAAYCPDLVTWAVRGADESGVAGAQTQAMPLLTFGHHSFWGLATGTTPERRPQGFNLDVHTGLDSDTQVMTRAISGHAGIGGLWDDTAPWVGRRITVQIGMHPSPDNRNNVANNGSEYRVYIAATPKGSLKYAAGEDPQAEFAYYADVTIQKKDIPRLVVVIGGGWNPQLSRGYTEYSARMVVDKVRVYGATAAGDLPSVSGNVTPDKRGKILGANSLPQRKLDRDDILLPLGVGASVANLEESSSTVQASGGSSFFTQLPEATRDSVQEKFLVALADRFRIPSSGGVIEDVQEFYWVQSVAAGGSSMTLATPYSGPESTNAAALQTNLIGYTTFDGALDEINRSPLSLGSGAPYQPGVTRTEDLILSAPLFLNEAPIDGWWRVRIASPFLSGSLARVLPKWVRGIVAPRRGRVTGIASLDDALFASVKGAIYRVDDRWREDGPTDVLRKSLSFNGKGVQGLEMSFPAAGDGARFTNYTNVWPYWSPASFVDQVWVYDFWVYIEEYAENQTLMWLGCEYAHLLQGPANTDGRRGIGIWLRLSSGRPEIVRESQGIYSGGAAAPPDGRYTATAADSIPLRKWTHIRFWLDHVASGGSNVVKTPAISINGRRVRVQLNATESGLLAGEWIKAWNGGGLIGSAGDSRNSLYLGVGRDAIRTQAKSQFAAVSQLGGREYPGSRVTGRMHPLLGRMAGVTVWRAASSDPSVSGFPDFNPHTLSYSGAQVRFRADLQEGEGEYLDDAGTDVEPGFTTDVPGVVLSHPGIDLFNEFGSTDQAPSFVAAEQRIYAANGGRVAYVTESSGGPAGIIAPVSPLKATVERKPLWEPNYTPIGSSSAEQDPIFGGASDAGQPIYHYSSHGSAYMAHRWSESMTWEKADSVANTPFDVFGFKCYFHPREVAGRVPIYTARTSTRSGGLALECVDGKVRVGWYDTAQKAEVFVESNAPVFRPGHWYYIYLRKAFPMRDAQEGNWLNSYFSNGLRRRAAFTITAGSWAVGDFIRNGGSTKRGLVTKVYAGRIEYLLFSADADFAAAEVVNNGAGATGTIDATPHHMTGDSIVVREFSKTGTMLDTVLWGVKAGAHRNAISFTSEMPRSINTTAIGQVTPAGVLFSGTAGGQVSVGTMLTVAAPFPVFHPDMVGMQFQFSSLVTTQFNKVYRISAYVSPTAVNVVDENGNSPNLSAFTNRNGGVFSGVELSKSDGFDSSAAPDRANYNIELFGSSLSLDPASGVARTNAKWASFGYQVVSSLVSNSAFYSGFTLFETIAPTDLNEIGTDAFTVPIYNTTTALATSRPGELHFDTGFMVVDGQTYAGESPSSTQPNEALLVARDTMANASAETIYFKRLQDPAQSGGKRRVFCIFYDEDQDARSNPSPEVEIDVPDEDKANPSGLTRLLISDLPVSHQPGRIQRWLYVTPANDLVPMRVAIIPDNLSSSATIVLDDSKLDTTEILSFRNPAPPNAGVIGLSQSIMFYGDVTVDGVRRADGIYFSDPFFPVQVPYGNFLALISGSNERITGMVDLNGVLVVWKKDAMLEVVVRDNLVLQRGKSKAVGLVGPQAVAVLDQQVFWLSNDRGAYLYTGSGGPIWIGENIGDIFDGDSWTGLAVDGKALANSAIAVNRRQDQIVCLWKDVSEKDQRRRFGIEFDGALAGTGIGDAGNGFRYSLYAGPNVSAIGAVDRSIPGTQRFVGGTAEGFVVLLDHKGATTEMLSPGASMTATLVAAGSTTTKLVLSAPPTLSYELEGLRGVPISWNGGRATCLFASGSTVWLDRAIGAVPANGTTLFIGAQSFDWRSKWFDFGNSEERKILEWLDLVVPSISGQAILELYLDHDHVTSKPFVVNGQQVASYTITSAFTSHKLSLGELRARFVQFRIRTDPASQHASYEVTEAVFRVIESEPHS